LKPGVRWERHDLTQRNCRGKSAGDDCASTGAHDEIESVADIQRRNATLTCEGIGQFAKVCAGVDAAHSAAVQAENPEWPCSAFADQIRLALLQRWSPDSVEPHPRLASMSIGAPLGHMSPDQPKLTPDLAGPDEVR
jgi:hypothetical protein